MESDERVLAIEEIRVLKARYFRFVDTKDWAGLAALFTADMVFERGHGHSVRDPWTGEWKPAPPQPALVHGRDAVIRMIREAVEKISTVHHGHMPEIDLIDADNATAIWAMSDELRDRSGKLILSGRGHYHDRYRRTDAGWRIAASRLSRIALLFGDGERKKGGE